MSEMNEQGRSVLIGKRFRLEGFTIERHPLGDRGRRIQVTVFAVLPDELEHVICISEITERMVKRHRRQLKQRLGAVIGHESVAPFAQRSVAPVSFEELRPVIEEGWPGATFRWWDGK
jgi:hypothetical protein